MWWRCCWLGNIRALDAVVHTHHAFHGIHKCFSHSTNYIWYMIWNFARQHFTEIYTLSSGGHKYVFFYINIVNNSNKILSSQRYVFFEVCAVKSKVINQPPPHTHVYLTYENGDMAQGGKDDVFNEQCWDNLILIWRNILTPSHNRGKNQYQKDCISKCKWCNIKLFRGNREHLLDLEVGKLSLKGQKKK